MWKTITLPNRMHDYNGINDYIQEDAGKDTDGKGIMTLHFDISFYCTIFNINPSYEVNLTQGDYAKLHGFDKKTISDAGVVGNRVPNKTRGVDWVYIHCDLIGRRARDGKQRAFLLFHLQLRGQLPLQKKSHGDSSGSPSTRRLSIRFACGSRKGGATCSTSTTLTLPSACLLNNHP